jgi:hypothetical protein
MNYIGYIYKMAAIREAVQCNLFKEYKGVAKYKDQSDFQAGRYLVFQAIVDMLRLNPDTGDSYEEMTDRESQEWRDTRIKIRQGGELLNKGGDMYDPLVWSFIPSRFHADLDANWDGVGDWRH